MSGHSKWSTIKHKKAINDAKRGAIFTKLARDVAIAARAGGDPEMNFQLRLAMERAKAANMPKDNIERAIKKGTGESKDGMQIEEAVYEAYGPGQIAMLVKTATDNKNRTLSEVRSIINKNGGKFVEGGSVSWQFEQAGFLVLEKGEMDDPSFAKAMAGREEIEMKIIESGAKDYEVNDEGNYEIYTQFQELQKVKESFESDGLRVGEAALILLAKEKMEVDDETKAKYDKLLEALGEQEDVVDVYDNLK